VSGFIYADVALVPTELEAMPLERFGAVAVIDVLRATTTMVTALENGARGIVPVATPAEAFAWRAAGPAVLLGGERGAQRIHGFDLGNSPLEYTRERVAGRLVVLTTTNGTLAFRRALVPSETDAGAPVIIAACLRNAGAAARHLREAAAARERGVLLVCAGTNGWFSAEDAYCAAVVLQALEELGPVDYGDGARAAARFGALGKDPLEELRATRHGRRLLELGFHEDMAYCAQVGVSKMVPRLTGGVLAAGEARGPAEAGAYGGGEE